MFELTAVFLRLTIAAYRYRTASRTDQLPQLSKTLDFVCWTSGRCVPGNRSDTLITMKILKEQTFRSGGVGRAEATNLAPRDNSEPPVLCENRFGVGRAQVP